ncbi:MAG: O-antigen ligase family protein, partial [Patescibacteria group bacterium]
MGILFFILVFLGFGAIAWRSLPTAIAVLLAVLPLYTVRLSIGPLPTTLLEACVLALVGVWLVRDGRTALRDCSVLVKERHRPKPAALLFWSGATIFLLASLISIVISPKPVQALGVWRAYFLEPALVFVVLVRTISTVPQLTRCVHALLISGMAVASIAIIQWFTGWGLSGALLLQHRVTSLYPYPNAVWLYLAPIIPIIAYHGLAVRRSLSGSGHHVRHTFIWGGAVSMMLLAIWFAQTEAAIVALLVVGVLGMIFWSETARKRTIIITILGILAVMVASPLSSVVSKKLQLKDWSGKVRKSIWQESVAMLSDRWLLGAGLVGYQTALEPYHKARHLEIFLYPHNVILNFWSETGLFGVLGFFILAVSFFWFFSSYRIGLKQGRAGPDFDVTRGLTFGFVSSMGVVLVHGLVDVPYLKNDLAIFFWFLLAAALIMHTNFYTPHTLESPDTVKAKRVASQPVRKKKTPTALLAVFVVALLGAISWEQTNAGALLQRSAPRAESVAVIPSHQFFECGITWCLTAQMLAGEPFQSLVVEWPKEAFLEARIFDSGRWTPWTPLVGESDVRDGEPSEENAFFFSANSGTHFQLRAPAGAPALATVRMFTVPPLSDEPAGHDVRISSLGDNEGPTLLSRSQWLGDLALSREKLESLWPPEYEEVKKIIIHHTASTVRDVNGDGALDGSDYRELVRAIYHYHASSKKWGDIGYQYIIDPDGTIYEGRFGGDGVVGGHAYRSRACTKFGPSNMPFNKGTIGISLLGTYQDQSISLQAHEALTTLIAEKAWEFEFEPSGSGFFQDRVYPNIIAHRDVDCTSCPGDTLYNTLSEISNISQQKFDLARETRARLYHAEMIPGSVPTRITLIPGQPQTITAQFKNTGTATWRAYGSQKLSLAPSNIKERLASLESVRLAALNDAREEGGRDLTTAPLPPKEDPSIRLVQPNVRPGEIGTFELTVPDPPPELESEQSYVLTLGNRGWFADGQISFEVENAGLEWAGTRVLDEG